VSMTALLFVASCTLAAGKDYTAAFSAWKQEHGKDYTSAAAEVKAFKTFTEHEDKITTHNAQPGVSFLLGHNEFSDLTTDEFFADRLGYNASLARERVRNTAAHVSVPKDQLDSSVDWVTKGAVTAIKNQGTCGSCWSFSATGAIEGALQIATGKLVSLSEEDLVQCDTDKDNGCQGGLMDNAFDFVKKNGIASESSYSYTSGTGIRGLCDAKKEKVSVASVSGHTDVPTDDEDALLSAVAKGPVSVAIEADKSAFQLYKSGVLDSFLCGKQLDHGVLVVGYGQDTGLFKKQYWKVKNSWGATWGESGYIRMVRGKNMCGIATQASYPTGASAVSA